MITIPNPYNLVYPRLDKLIEETGRATPLFDIFLTNLTDTVKRMAKVDVTQWGARGDDNSDDSVAFNQAVQTLILLGGGTIYIPPGNYILDFPVFVPAGTVPVMFYGAGTASVVRRRGALPVGTGMFDVSGSNVFFENFLIDGGTTVPVGLQYNADFNGVGGGSDPMADSLTRNTSVWVHGPGTGYGFQQMTFTHAAGYSILGDALTGTLTDFQILNCVLKNNRPTLFGTTPGDLIYGSWNGGIFFKGDARSATGSESGVVKNVLVQGCRFERNNGNCIWSHNYGFELFHENFRYVGNQFLDCGLDGILVQCVSGGIVASNILRRVGYTTLTDTDQSTPRWLAGLNATAIDSGVVKSVPYVGNSIVSANGGAIDLDTHCMSAIGNNLIRVPYSDEPEYEEDQISITGPTASGNGSYGLNLAVNYPIAEGGMYINVVGNTILNLPAGAMRLYSSRYCNVVANIIQAPADSTYAPIQLGPNGAAAYNRCYGNRISQNQVEYDPATPGDPVVLEDDSLSGGNPMTGGEANTVCNNNPIEPSGTTAIEFQPAGGSGSVVYSSQIWFP